MRRGDLIECNSGHQGIVVGIEYMYPKNPEYSPPRNLQVLWSDSHPKYAFRIEASTSTISAFSVKRVISRANR